MILNNSKEFSRFLRFAIVGLIGAGIDFGVFNLLIGLAGVPSIAAGAISFICAVCSNFLFNRYWTYPDSRTKSIPHQVMQFFMVSVVGLGIRTMFFAWMEPPVISLFRRASIPGFISPTLLGHNFTLAVAIVVVMFWNFFVNRYWTYADVN
jgi:putative flippase GtrA